MERKVSTIYQRAKEQRDGDYLEIDVLAVDKKFNFCYNVHSMNTEEVRFKINLTCK